MASIGRACAVSGLEIAAVSVEGIGGTEATAPQSIAGLSVLSATAIRKCESRKDRFRWGLAIKNPSKSAMRNLRSAKEMTLLYMYE
ncbi:MAG: hypothetical protein ABI036_10990 [Fibrobacteria bacterium]